MSNLKKFFMNQNIIIRSSFGHEIFALWVAKLFNSKVFICPDKDSEEEYNTEAKKIRIQMSFFASGLETAPFSKKAETLANGWDIVKDLRAGKLPRGLWKKLAKVSLRPTATDGLPEYAQLQNRQNILVIMQKWLSDNGCGITAKQQSLPVEVFGFLRKMLQNLVFGQHFHKVNDLAGVEAVAKAYDMYVPGLSENPEVLGIRGILHAKYYNMYKALAGSVGIAGTHTWYLLAMFPETPQIILYNRNGVEDWEEIAEAMRKGGRKVWAVGFDENTDFSVLAKEIEEKYLEIFG